MKKTLAISMLVATLAGGVMLAQPAEAYGWHHIRTHEQYINYGNYTPCLSRYQTVPVRHRFQTGWWR